MTRVLFAAVPATVVAYTIGVNGNGPAALLPPIAIGFFFGPVILGSFDGARFVLLAALLSAAAIAIASPLANHHSGWQPCLPNGGGLDGNSPAPCRGDMSLQLGIYTFIWIFVVGTISAAAERLRESARKRRQLAPT